jgi:CHAT domain
VFDKQGGFASPTRVASQRDRRCHYASLLEPGVNKAEALRRVQRTLMADKATVHPYYWAAFLLIGNWR